jgi:hypothetical protein
MTRRQIRDNILRVVWVHDPDNAPSHVLEDVATAVNKSLQTLYLLPGAEFYTLSDYEVTVAAGTNSIALASAMQRLDSVRRSSGAPLAPVDSRQDILNYRVRFEGATTESAGVPVAYWLEQRRSNGDDAAAATLFVAPTPESNTLLKLEGKSEATAYTVSEMENESAGISIAHGYVESLFLPLARYEASLSSWFKDPALRDSLRTAAEAAFTAVGLAAPWAVPEKTAA